jgi:hypothetical protein
MDDELKKQKAREYARRYRQENKEKVRKAIDDWRNRNRDKVNENSRLYKEKNKEKVKEWNNKYYARNIEKVKEKHRQDFQNKKEYYYQKRREYMVDLMNWVDGMKQEKGCGNCGTLENLTYHHIDPKTKVMEIADMVNAMKNRNEILEETKKCSVLCLSCHMKYHKENGK